ncbi:MAG: hypothetical protein US75_C0043G0003 [Candidatus Woesebacteria bacterium GW2011_GWC1_38_13]|uniref:Uncharacterized protein n=1 Tax=Candidatus Woesebacteria bacterium GW2011_GWC1_38_13 TaxID=1618583 RepID=A0A0G0IT28_9BACT|nr:MAG: hypothetical protein US75_C0043G0003 [Candidatus Woesebacteria bacterium GW2011_GWC1_38_13]
MRRKIIKKIAVLILTGNILLAGWPGIFGFGLSNIQNVEAVNCGFGSEIGTSGACRGFLTISGSNQTWTSPSDWNNSSNTIECIGAGGSGGAASKNTSNVATGGGGGAYSLISNFSVATPGTTQVTYRIGAGGAATSISNGTVAGNVGEDTWFNNTAFPGSGTDNIYCGAKGGQAGAAGALTQNGGAGGVDTSGWGQTRRSGGSGGTASHSSVATGGGGTAGNSSMGGIGVSSSTTNSATNGGQANGSGALGGTGGTSGTNGGDGTEYTTEGSGGGGGGTRQTVNSVVYGGDGGKRGGGGAGSVNYRTAGTPSAESGAGYDGIIIITYTPIIDPTITQNDWRMYVDNSALDPTDPWGSPDLGENSPLTSIPYANDPIDPGDNIRIRITMVVGDAALSASLEGFILQYGEGSSCSAISSWTDVDAISGSGIWRYYDNASITDGTALSSTDPPTAGDLNIGVSDRAGRYVESDPTTTNPYAVAVGEDMEWDFNVQYNGNAEAHTYCFKIRRDTPADLDGYNASSYPQVDTRPGAGDLLRHGNFFTTGIERGIFWAD